jgi:phenylpyruvate tautomerase PptA (4-oxalocrotonate tautomerase family)
MPFINMKVNVRLDKVLKDKFSENIISIAGETLGKGETWVMTGIEDDSYLYFRGSSDKAAMVEVKLYGDCGSSAYTKMTGKICDLINAELKIPQDRIYVAYLPLDNWGYAGSNF